MGGLTRDCLFLINLCKQKWATADFTPGNIYNGHVTSMGMPRIAAQLRFGIHNITNSKFVMT